MKHAVIVRKNSPVGLIGTVSTLFSVQAIGFLTRDLLGMTMTTILYFVFRVGLRRLFGNPSECFEPVNQCCLRTGPLPLNRTASINGSTPNGR